MQNDRHIGLVMLLPWLAAAALGFFVVRALWTGTIRWRGRPEPLTRRDQPAEYWFSVGLFAFFAGFLLWAGFQP